MRTLRRDMNEPKRVKCPYCAEELIEGVRKCRYCGEWLEKPEGKAGPSA